MANFDPSSIGAMPADFDPSSIGATPAQNPGMLPGNLNRPDETQQPDYLKSLGLSAVQGLTNLGGNIISDVGTGVKYLGANKLGEQLQQFGQQGANVTPQQMGIPNPGIGNSLVSGAVQASPYLAAIPEMGALDIAGAAADKQLLGTISKMPVMRDLITPLAQKSGLAGALFGASQSSPGEAVSGALENAAGWMGVQAIPGAGKAVINGVKDLAGHVTGKPLQDATDAAYNSISKGMSPDELNKTNTQNIIGNYDAQVQKIGQDYKDLSATAEQRGYLPTGNKPIAGLFEQTNQKFIDPSKDTSTILDNLANKQDAGSPLKNISTGLKNAINQYQTSPTYSNAHTLQSMLGTEAADFSSGIATDIADKQTAAILNTARRQLKSDITSNFEKNGDKDLAQQYQDLSDQWKSNVVPYQNVSGVWRAIKGKDHPSNILNVLDNNDEIGSNQTIRDHLKANPESSPTILAQALNSAARKDSIGTYRTTPQKMIDKYNNLPESIRQLANPGLDQQMNDLQKLLDSHNAWSQPAKDLAKKLGVGLGIGAGASIGYNGYRLMKDL